MSDTDPYVTESGKVLTDADIEALADEAERGYDVSRLALRQDLMRPLHGADRELVDSDLLPVVDAYVQQRLAEQQESIAKTIEAVTWLHPHDRAFVAKIAREWKPEPEQDSEPADRVRPATDWSCER